MQVFAFDPEVSRPITQYESDFRMGALTGPDASVLVQVMHLPAGGRVGRHEAAVPQLFAVVVGEGWVSGGDGTRRPIGPGTAALWEAGEQHEAHSDEGLTAVCIEGEFDVWALAITRDLVVADYDPDWPHWFDQISAHVWPAVEDVALRIDHVGSTAVPGLAAKPIIDMDIVVASEDDVRPVLDRLAGIGYRWRGDLGIVGRESVAPIRNEALPRHNLYVVVENNKAHLDHWLLRDLLRDDQDARERYADVKRRSAAATDDIDVYLAAKAELVAELLTRARAERGLPPTIR